MDQAVAPDWGVSEAQEGTPAGTEAERSAGYALLAALLARAPEGALLERLAGIEIGETERDAPLAPAWDALARAAREADPEALADEYQVLFIGVGRGEVVPYGSWYLTGFMLDRPLAELRADLAALGIERTEGTCESEDHAAALLEAMGLLIEEAPADLAGQRRFFTRHIAPWMGTFFRDLQEAEHARFYRAVGLLGGQFIDFEDRYLHLPE